MASNHAKHDAWEQIYRERKTTEKRPTPDTATEAEAIINQTNIF